MRGYCTGGIWNSTFRYSIDNRSVWILKCNYAEITIAINTKNKRMLFISTNENVIFIKQNTRQQHLLDDTDISMRKLFTYLLDAYFSDKLESESHYNDLLNKRIACTDVNLDIDFIEFQNKYHIVINQQIFIYYCFNRNVDVVPTQQEIRDAFAIYSNEISAVAAKGIIMFSVYDLSKLIDSLITYSY